MTSSFEFFDGLRAEAAVRPHDNALRAAGLVRYGLVDEAQRVATAVLDAEVHFGHRSSAEVDAGVGEAWITGLEDTGVQVLPGPVTCRG